MVARLNITDMGDTFSALAQETISGGQLVKAVSGATVLTTTNAISNVIEVMKVDAVADGVACVGVALTTAASGERVTIGRRGVHGFYAAEAITAGAGVMPADAVTTADAITDIAFATTGSKLIGTALSTAGSGQLVAVALGGYL